MESYSFDQPLKLTKTSSSINTIPETDNQEDNGNASEKDPFSSILTTSASTDTSISWTSRLSYQLHMGLSYKLRTFSSRGALLVLMVNFLVSAGYGIPAGNGNAYHFYEDPHSIRHDQIYPDEPSWQLRDIVPVVFWSPAILVLGLLADIRFGRRAMVMFGIVLLWLAVIADCIRVTVFYYSPHFPHKNEIFHTVFLIDAVLCYVATAAFLVNSVQLAIDQLVDASAEQITSFIQWFMFSYFLGAWVFTQLTEGPLHYCYIKRLENIPGQKIKVVVSLVQVVFVSLALCLMYVCGSWIRDIPTKNNPLKLIWQVLSFTARHKYPVRRSALTYWEDEIPSRINLGKDKYGGPFTNEQVEDVKTFFRMLCVGIPCIAMATSCFLVQDNFVFSVSQNWTLNTLMDFNYYKNLSVGNSTCIQSLFASFLANLHLWVCIYTLCNELLVYPLFSRCIPSMLKRIGLVFLMMVPVGIILLILNIVAYATNSVTIHRLPICCAITAIAGFQYYVIISSLLEFICAQSPQSMKGFLIGFMWLMTVLLVVISYFIYYVWSLKCIGPGCGIGYFSLVTLLGVTGFIVYCVVAKWYRHRERDDCPNNQAIVEEVFARRFENRKKLGVEDSSSFVYDSN